MEKAGDSSRVLMRVKGRFAGFPGRLDWVLEAGQNWALVGADTVDKSRFCAVVAGCVPSPHGLRVDAADELEGQVQLVSFDAQRAAADKNGFMQARYCSIEDDAGPGDTVRDVLSFNRVFDVNPFEVGHPRRAERRVYARTFRRIVRLMNLTALLDRDFLALSNGETRRALIARALLASPKLLVLDDPFAGLDPNRRAQLKDVLNALAARGTTLVLAVTHEDEIPSCVTNRLEVNTRKRPAMAQKTSAARRTPQVPAAGKPVVEIRHLHVAFGRRILFKDFSWTVRAGERWVIRGSNGCGKTTLFSLVIGDNPRAYACDVRVFGLPREPGVELARIRRRIGMVSPELQAYSGLDAEALLARALAGKPDLLLLDEPCMNLDRVAANRVHRAVAAYLKNQPACTVLCIAHRPEDVPPGFPNELDLSAVENEVMSIRS